MLLDGVFASLLSTHFPSAGLSAPLFCADLLPDWSWTAKRPQLLITHLTVAYPTHQRCLRSNGLVVRVVASEARGPVFDSSSDQMVFSLLGYRE